MSHAQPGAETAVLLDALDRCRDAPRYRKVLDRAIRRVERKLRFQPAEADRLVAALSRHATAAGPGTEDLVCEAMRGLRSLCDHPQVLGRLVLHACAGTGRVREVAERALRLLGEAAVPRLIKETTHPIPVVRERAMALLDEFIDFAFPVLVWELSHVDPERVLRAVQLIRRLDHPRRAEVLAGWLTHDDPRVRREVANTLRRIGCESVQRSLTVALYGPDEIGELAAHSLAGARTERAIDALVRVVDPRSGRSVQVRGEAIRSLGELETPRAGPVLTRVLARRGWLRRRQNRNLRLLAAESLGRIGGPMAVAVLKQHSGRGDRTVRIACSKVLSRLSAS